MHYKHLLWILRIIALFSFVGLVFIFIYTSPYAGQNPTKPVLWNIVLMDSVLFVFLSAIFSIFLFRIRRMGKKRMKNQELVVLGLLSIRQGVLLGLGTIILLVLQSFNILTWWDGLLAIGGILMLELYFLVR